MSRRPLSLLSLAVLGLGGCARQAGPKAEFAPWVGPDQSAESSKKEDRALALSQTSPITTPFRDPLPSDAALPGGEACLEQLRARKVQAKPLPGQKGVDTPVVVTGPISGVEFFSDNGPMVLDCRLALGLSDIAPDFQALGVTRARFSGAYVYRTSKQGRLSLHAYGLAIDIHQVFTKDGLLSVEHDYKKALVDGCTPEAPLLNRLACRLRARGLFRELLTPDYDADHHDHIHLGIAPLPSAALLASAAKPKVLKKDPVREPSPQVKPPRQRVEESPAVVQAAAGDAGIASLWADLQILPEGSPDSVDAPAPDQPGELLPVEAQGGEIARAGAPE